MNGVISNDNGTIIIDNEVVAKSAAMAALDCFGIVGMATISVRDGLAKLLKGDSNTKGINVKIDDNNELLIDFHVIVAYGVGIKTVVSNLIKTVRYRVEEFTGLKVKNINVYVEGVRVID
ncbi:MAG: Asp23/Gls24 family envelope stress response protein [Eubacterium sp.]|nr:Asp23/Gls24 family envelope stress response protein [Eubacterium sp.]HBE08928.1 Asp23/Gls24 family envelope stress response protein [Lachnospiraceae bacterium]